MDPALYSQSNINNWGFRSYHMALDGGGKNTNAITAENVLIASGPARLSQVGQDFGTRVFPIGLLDNVQISQQKQLQPIREIGSRRNYIIGSYSAGNMSLSRVMFSQASLLHVLYAGSDDRLDIDNPASANLGSTFAGQDDVAPFTAQRVLSINLQSELFDRPTGQLFYMLDQRNNPYGAFYVEEVMVQSHSVGLSSGSVAISEMISMLFDRAVPVAVTGD